MLRPIEKGVFSQIYAQIQRTLPALAVALEVMKIHSERQVGKKVLENMRKTLQDHLEGHQQLDLVRRTKECYTRAELK